MQAKYKRKIKPGTEYNRYFQLAELNRTDPMLMGRADVFDTILEMSRIVKKTLADTREIAPVLRGATLEQTCRNLFDFVYHHIQYTLDKPGVEQLRRPLRTWADRAAGVDCDCYSIFLSSILTNLGIDHYFRMTKYRGDWQHIYVIVPKGKSLKGKGSYYTLDCVVDAFDYEVPFSAKHDKRMSALQYLDGVPSFGLVNPGFGAEFIGFGKGTLSGLGAATTPEDLAQDFFDRTKLHLQNTLAIIKAHPKMLPAGSNFRSQVEFALKNWDNPLTREAALDKLAAEEEPVLLSGLGQLGGLWDTIKKGAKAVGNAVTTAAKAVATGATNAANWVGDKAEDGWEAAKDGAEFLAKKVVQLNPLSVAMRNGLLLAFKINLFRMAERLGYGYWTEAQAQAKGLNLAEFRKVKEKLEEVHKLWRGLQGDEDSLRKNILQGHNHGVEKHGGATLGSLSFGTGLGEVVTATAGTAVATPLIVKVVDWLSKIDFNNLFAKFAGPKPEDYSGYNTVNEKYIPHSEADYLANKQRYDNPSPPDTDNSLLVIGGIGLLAFVLLSSK